jgi:hypothetical protein
MILGGAGEQTGWRRYGVGRGYERPYGLGPPPIEQLRNGCRERHTMFPALLGFSIRLGPDAMLQINLAPLGIQRFAKATTGKQRE